jgi:hypothetical protein
MYKPELYHKTVNILYDAYFNDTLRHGNCNACAVGNLVAANLGIKYRPYIGIFGDLVSWNSARHIASSLIGWPTVFTRFPGATEQEKNPFAYEGQAKIQIDSTGYTWRQLAKIEYAFETAKKGRSDEDYMFNGLIAVLEVLKKIHKVEDDEPVQKRFNDHYLVKTK